MLLLSEDRVRKPPAAGAHSWLFPRNHQNIFSRLCPRPSSSRWGRWYPGEHNQYLRSVVRSSWQMSSSSTLTPSSPSSSWPCSLRHFCSSVVISSLAMMPLPVRSYTEKQYRICSWQHLIGSEAILNALDVWTNTPRVKVSIAHCTTHSQSIPFLFQTERCSFRQHIAPWIWTHPAQL